MPGGGAESSDDEERIEVAIALVDVLLAEIDAVNGAIARTPSSKARAALQQRRDALQVELDQARAALEDDVEASGAIAAPFAEAPIATDEDEPSTDQSPSPFARAPSSSAPDTAEVRRDGTVGSSEDSQKRVVFASAEGAPLSADSRVKAGPGLFDLRGAPEDVRAIANVLCSAIEPVRVKDLRASTSQSLEKLLLTLRRLVMLKLVVVV